MHVCWKTLKNHELSLQWVIFIWASNGNCFALQLTRAKLLLLSDSIRSKTQTNHDFHACIFSAWHQLHVIAFNSIIGPSAALTKVIALVSGFTTHTWKLFYLLLILNRESWHKFWSWIWLLLILTLKPLDTRWLHSFSHLGLASRYTNHFFLWNCHTIRPYKFITFILLENFYYFIYSSLNKITELWLVKSSTTVNPK